MRRSRNWFRLGRSFLPALLIAVAVVALGLVLTNQGAAAASGGATVNIEIGDNFFNPRNATANVGDTIVWTNKGNVAHDVTASNGAFSSPRNLAPGASFSYTATAAGTFAYICTIHVNHDGTLVIQAAAAPSAAPSASPAATVPGAAPRTGGGGMVGVALQPWQQLLALGLLASAIVATIVARRLRRAA
jgi:plastocyanin